MDMNEEEMKRWRYWESRRNNIMKFLIEEKQFNPKRASRAAENFITSMVWAELPVSIPTEQENAELPVSISTEQENVELPESISTEQEN